MHNHPLFQKARQFNNSGILWHLSTVKILSIKPRTVQPLPDEISRALHLSLMQMPTNNARRESAYLAPSNPSFGPCKIVNIYKGSGATSFSKILKENGGLLIKLLQSCGRGFAK
jgi:hypothetical protein